MKRFIFLCVTFMMCVDTLFTQTGKECTGFIEGFKLKHL